MSAYRTEPDRNKHRGAAKVAPEVTYEPVGGDPLTRSAAIRLKRP